ncbi:hypothetical protein AMATHDRAFT_3861 [Amanita thiersii Skay4041]|uniref:Uncharacterized protein n=1 Tax=Amanita thiersii Skay4041 TaxID=703135 RepID=A0A2A9NJ12_9AGAR|nr:hypothetical protein AMATHDRAFT_3861 [Amanita thiersii Skay4041]
MPEPLIPSSSVQLSLKMVPPPIAVAACIVSPPILIEPTESVIIYPGPIPCVSGQQPGSSTLGAKITGLKERISAVEAENFKLKKEVAGLKTLLYQPETGVSGASDNGEQQGEEYKLKNELEHLKNDYRSLKLKAESTAEELLSCKSNYDAEKASNIELKEQIEAARQEMYKQLVVTDLKVTQFNRFISAMIDIKLDEPVLKRAYRALQSGRSSDAALVASIKEASKKEGSPWATIIPAVVGDRPPELYLLAVKRCADLDKRLSESNEKLEKMITRMDAYNRNTGTPSPSSLLDTCDMLPCCDISATTGSPQLQSEPKHVIDTPRQILFGSISKSMVSTLTDFGPRLVCPGNASASSIVDTVCTVRSYIPRRTHLQNEDLTDLNEQCIADQVTNNNDSLTPTIGTICVTRTFVSGHASSQAEDVKSRLMSQGDQWDVSPQTFSPSRLKDQISSGVTLHNGSLNGPPSVVHGVDSRQSFHSILDKHPRPLTSPVHMCCHLQRDKPLAMTVVETTAHGLQVSPRRGTRKRANGFVDKSQISNKTRIMNTTPTPENRRLYSKSPSLAASPVVYQLSQGPKHARRVSSGTDQKSPSSHAILKERKYYPPILEREGLCSKGDATSLVKQATPPPTGGIRRATISSTLKAVHFQNPISGSRGQDRSSPESLASVIHTLMVHRPLAEITSHPASSRTKTTPHTVLDHSRKAVKTLVRLIS